MINILPIEEKKKTIAEYRSRVFVVVSFALAILVATAIVLLVPSYLLAVSKFNFASSELVRLELAQGDTNREKDMDTETKSVNKKISLFVEDKKAPQRFLSEFMYKILGDKSAGIKLRSFSYSMNTTREQVIISGTAKDREALSVFSEKLKADTFYSKVDLPLGSYVKSTDIDFVISLERAGAKVVAPKK